MSQVLVTGHTGFIGRQVTTELLNRGYKVCGISEHNRLPEHPNLQQYNLNLLNPAEVDCFFDEHSFENLIHLAWYIGSKCHIADVNIEWLSASLHLLEAFQKHGGKKVLCNGTISEYDFSYGYLSEDKTPLNNPSLHGQCKAALFKVGACFCRQHQLDFKWARVFNLYGPYERSSRLMPSVINSMLKGEDVKVSDCLKFQDYLHVADTARGIVDLFESDNQGAINICSGTPVCLRTIVEKIAELTDFKGNILWGAIPSGFEDPMVVGDNQKLTAKLGWKQQISLEEGLKMTINWWRNNNV